MKIKNKELSEDYQNNKKLFEALAIGCTINNNSRIDIIGQQFKKVGEPTEAALKVFAEKLCGSPTTTSNAFSYQDEMSKKLNIIAALDFTSERKSMSTIV